MENSVIRRHIPVKADQYVDAQYKKLLTQSKSLMYKHIHKPLVSIHITPWAISRGMIFIVLGADTFFVSNNFLCNF